MASDRSCDSRDINTALRVVGVVATIRCTPSTDLFTDIGVPGRRVRDCVGRCSEPSHSTSYPGSCAGNCLSVLDGIVSRFCASEVTVGNYETRIYTREVF